MNKKRTWIVDEGSPGHLAQSRGLADALKSHEPNLEITEIKIGRRFSGMQRSLIRWLMGPSGRRVPSFLRDLVLKGVQLPEGRPDLILSSGGKGVFTGRLLANQFDVPYVFVGERKPYRSEWFHTVFTPSPRECAANDCRIGLIPTGVTPDKVKTAAIDYDAPGGPLWSMIVGGCSKSHKFQEDDWKSMAREMNDLAGQFGIRWLLTSSRRTGQEAERLLEQHLDPAAVADTVWWSKNPRKRMLAFLGSAERVFVTQDSVTMVTEAICSGRPVSVIAPARVTFPRNSFMRPYLEGLEAKGLIHRTPITRMGLAPSKMRAEVIPDPVGQIVEALIRRLP